MTTTFRIDIPSLRELRPDDRRAIAGALLDAARAWVDGHTLRRSLDAQRIEVTAQAAPARAAVRRAAASLPLPGVSHACDP
jgi:hypothetical protein